MTGRCRFHVYHRSHCLSRFIPQQWVPIRLHMCNFVPRERFLSMGTLSTFDLLASRCASCSSSPSCRGSGVFSSTFWQRVSLRRRKGWRWSTSCMARTMGRTLENCLEHMDREERPRGHWIPLRILFFPCSRGFLNETVPLVFDTHRASRTRGGTPKNVKPEPRAMFRQKCETSQNSND